jgi:hypothetical protein
MGRNLGKLLLADEKHVAPSAFRFQRGQSVVPIEISSTMSFSSSRICG